MLLLHSLKPIATFHFVTISKPIRTILVLVLAWTAISDFAVVPAWASKDPEARTYLQKARAHAEGGAYERAFNTLAEGLEAHPGQRQLLQLRAELFLEIRDFESAQAAYNDLLNAGLRGSNRRKVRNIIRRLRSLDDTGVAVNLNVPADVYFDYKAFGMACREATECKKGLLPGNYRVIVERHGFAPVRKRVRLQRNRLTAVTIELKELPTPFTIDVHPSDAEIFLNGTQWSPSTLKGNGNGRTGDIVAGEYEVQIRRPGYFDYKTTISAHLGQPIDLQVALDRRVPIMISPPLSSSAATVEIGGRQVAVEESRVALVGDARRPATVGVLRLTPEMAHASSTPTAHELVVRMQGYAEARTPIAAEPSTASPESAAQTAPQSSKQYREPKLIHIILAPLPSPPLSPSPGPSDSRWHKRALVSAAAMTALAGYGLAVHYGLDARKQHRNALALGCTPNIAGRLDCIDRAGYDAEQRSLNAAYRADLMATVGTIATLGILWSGNLDQRPSGDGSMPRMRKLSIAVAGSIAVASLSLGAAYGWQAKSRRSDAAASCEEGPNCERIQDIASEAAARDTKTMVLSFATAGAAVITAGALWLTSPSPSTKGKQPRLRMMPSIGPRQIGARISFELP